MDNKEIWFIRNHYTKETDLIFDDDREKYIEWLETKLSLLKDDLINLDNLCLCSRGNGVDYDENNKKYCIDCNKYI